MGTKEKTRRAFKVGDKVTIDYTTNGNDWYSSGHSEQESEVYEIFLIRNGEAYLVNEKTSLGIHNGGVDYMDIKSGEVDFTTFWFDAELYERCLEYVLNNKLPIKDKAEFKEWGTQDWFSDTQSKEKMSCRDKAKSIVLENHRDEYDKLVLELASKEEYNASKRIRNLIAKIEENNPVKEETEVIEEWE